MKVLLHICCGVCAAGAAEQLLSEGFEVTGYFHNPNIYPYEEYLRRLEAAQKVAGEMGFPLEEGLYKADEWMTKTESLKEEPEGGKRCEVCFRYRLEETYERLLNSDIDCFTTTLTIGPRKPAGIVNRIGLEVGGDRFLTRDFKKKAGFQRATTLAKDWGIHRQHYCGCIYSM
ncbi:MAG: epoxyqueuosine reductase QueH [Dehalococcoidales bacterium]|nr:MAG: epoxyqueuosine reductase QueH [Dehalococcoidales bacterium]